MHALQLVAVALLVALPVNGFAVPILGRKLLIQGARSASNPRARAFIAKERRPTSARSAIRP
jgi:hypothetical protein